MRDREEQFQTAISAFLLGDLSDLDFKRRLVFDHGLDEWEADFIVSEFRKDRGQ